jgi:hypothetical protein
MDIIVDRPQLVKVVKLYLTKNFGDLTPKTSKDYRSSVFYVNSDNKIMMEYSKKTKYFFISHYDIWSKLESYFSIKRNIDIMLIMEDWLREHYDLEGLKLNLIQKISWDPITNLK